MARAMDEGVNGDLKQAVTRKPPAAARLACAAVLSGVEALINPEPIQAAAS